MMNFARFFIVMVVCVVSIIFVSCNKDSTEDFKFSTEDLMKTVTDSITDLPAMTTVNKSSDNASQLFSYLSSIDYDKIHDFTFSYASDNTAEEIAIICVKDSDDVDTIEKDLNKRLESRKATFATYDEGEVAKFKSATVVTKNNYVMLIIGTQAQNGKYSFNKAFE